jgi:hypothetical protein
MCDNTISNRSGYYRAGSQMSIAVGPRIRLALSGT